LGPVVTDLEIIYACLTATLGVVGLLPVKGAPFAAGVLLSVQLAGLGYALAAGALISAALIVVGAIIYCALFCGAWIMNFGKA
jgi:hypothetical protein